MKGPAVPILGAHMTYMSTCFVCLDDAGVLRDVPCLCNAKVHWECLQLTVSTVPAHRHACPVCKHPYHTLVTYEPLRYRVRACQCMGEVLLATFLALVLLCYDAYTFFAMTAVVSTLVLLMHRPVCEPVPEPRRRTVIVLERV